MLKSVLRSENQGNFVKRIFVIAIFSSGMPDLTALDRSTWEVIQQEIAGSKLVVIPGARHFSNVEQQGAFNAAITAFLAEQV